MAGLMDNVDQRTNLVGQNRLEMLLFRLKGKQLFGINVFKVKEVLPCPRLTIMPKSKPVVRGVSHIRGGTTPILDLGLATGLAPLENISEAFVIVTEYNGRTQGFLVSSVDRIVNMNWEDIKPPPSGSGRNHFLTAITHVDERIVEIIDVEKVLSQVQPIVSEIGEGVLDPEIEARANGCEILMVDDSYTAIAQAEATFSSIGIRVHKATDGAKGLRKLQEWADAGENVADKLLMLVTDAEMPVMDGYMLTTEVRRDPRLRDLFIVLHTSLSGSFNEAMVQKVGCDAFLSKFQPDGLARLVQDRIRSLSDAASSAN